MGDNMTKNKALKLALEAIDVYCPDHIHGLPKKHYITALREALAQPVQPEHHPQHSHTLTEMYAELHLYEEINQHYAKCNPGAANLRDWVAERMDKPQLEQEPVAYHYSFKNAWGDIKWHVAFDVPYTSVEVRPLFTSPKRPWVNLTDEEIEIIYAECSAWDKFEYERMLEAKLKELNT